MKKNLKICDLFANCGVLNDFPFPIDDFDSLTQYEMLIKCINHIKKLYANDETLTNRINALTNYIENLNLQDEVNNKIDEMVEDGTLAEIINETIFNELNQKIENISDKSLITYNTLEEMIEDTTLIENQNVYVMGNKVKNDGFSAYYKISSTGVENGKYTIKLDNDLYAILQNEIEDNYYKEVYFEKIRTDNTDCFFTHIPYLDENNEVIDFNLVQAETNTSPNTHAIKNNTNVTINASLAMFDSSDNTYKDGVAIGNGTIFRDYDVSSLCTDEVYLGIKADRTIETYQNDITAQELINAGVKNAFLIFGQCVSNGVIDPNFNHFTSKDCGQFIGQKEDKEIIILTFNGRDNNNEGLDYTQASQLLIDKGCVNVYVLDGGGSSSTSFRSIKINSNTDDNGIKDRKISYLLDCKKTITNKQTSDTYSYLGILKQNMVEELKPLINHREIKHYISCYNVSNQAISSSGGIITNYVSSSPSNSIISITNGVISINQSTDEYLSTRPYVVRITGRLVVENTTNYNTSHFIKVYEDNTLIATYRETISKTDWATFTLDEIAISIAAPRTYKIELSTAAPSSETSNVSGRINIEYIPKEDIFVN